MLSNLVLIHCKAYTKTKSKDLFFILAALNFLNIKLIRILGFALLFVGSCICSQAQIKLTLSGTVWKGTELPTKKGTELYFQNDTLVIVDLEGYNPADQYLTRQKGDTLFLSLIEENSFACREEKPARYKIFWANNGEKLYLKPLEDACITRFTLLVSESPWLRKREDNELRNDWYFLDPEKDKVPGISLYQAYNLLKFRKSSPVIVAVIDCPADYTHEDLKEKMWVNAQEIPDNKFDDDKNGHKDDVNGWFFNCSPLGIPIQNEQPEATQIYAMWKPRFDSLQGKKLTARDQRDLKVFEKAKIEYEKGREITDGLKILFSDSIKFRITLEKLLNQASEPVTKDQIIDWKMNADAYETGIIDLIFKTFRPAFQNFAQYVSQTKRNFSSLKREQSEKWLYTFNPDFNPRQPIGDHPEKFAEKMYGSGFLKQTSSMENDHGTHVAGIIGAKRGNGKGIDGIAENVKVMTLGAVPSAGDERDKDVANCIRYAVDNGAKIINMSFAKRFSPFKPEVDAAVLYAESKGALFINASGNSCLNTDSVPFYPTGTFENGNVSKTWIEVGNSTHLLNEVLVARTSNYGKKTVDLFAPGSSIFSTTPGNTYESFTGTSMSAPVVSGVAALIWSYFPTLTATELKVVLLESVYIPEIKEVGKPGTDILVPFSSLSKTGGILNAKRAVFAAEKMLKRKKVK